MFGLLFSLQLSVLKASHSFAVPNQSGVNYIASSPKQTGSTPIKQVQGNGTVVILPVNYDKTQTYPALILMPPTNRTASEFFNWAMSEAYRTRTGQPFIVILPPERGGRGDYSSGGAFESAIAYYEKSVRDNLTALIPKYNIDKSHIAIGGFSLGADLSWAISLRNPDLFKSAILIDSLCTYRLPQNVPQLASKKFRFVLIAGRKEGGEAIHPLGNVKAILDRNQIANIYKSFPSASHARIIELIPDAMWMESVDFALFDP
jgi:pimeloyl-ACP methyl ester carboxylesterase